MLEGTSPGKTIRMRRLFNMATQRSVIVAMDHGKTRGAVPGLENMAQTLELLMQERPDGILLNPGALRLTYRLWKGKEAPGIIVAADVPVWNSIPRGEQMGFEYRLLCTVEEIVALGADALKVLLVFCRKDIRDYGDNLQALARVIRAAESFGMPVMVETTFWGGAESKIRSQDASLVADVCRVATEMGADLLKVPFIGPPEKFRKVIDITPIPVTILGGAKTENIRDVFINVEEALKANVDGLVFGRNVWGQPKPNLVLHALKRMVHQGVSAEEVLREFSVT